MNKDNPDTIAMDEVTHWEATQADDVFLPSVRVQLGWSDVEAAVERGAIVPRQAHALWASWAAFGSPTRLEGPVQAAPAPAAASPARAAEPAARAVAVSSAGTSSALPSYVALLVAGAVGAGVTYLLLGA